MTGETLEETLRNKIFEPNGLKRTGYHFNLSDGQSCAYGYDNDVCQDNISNRIADLGEDWWVLKGKGGIQASARDMQRWAHVLRGEGALRPQTIRAMIFSFILSGIAVKRCRKTPYGWCARNCSKRAMDRRAVRRLRSIEIE